MAGFQTKTFLQYDDYTTPFYAWESIKDYIPKNKNIWCPFYCDGKQKEHFKKLDLDIIHNEEDFFINNRGDIIIDNPPFSKKKEVFTRLKELDKPFIIICPVSTLNAVFFRNLFKNENIQILIPRKRINFIKDGLTETNRCNFDCLFFCYKMKFEKDIIYLD